MSVLGGAEPSNKTENRGNTAANNSEQTNIGTNHGPVKINVTAGTWIRPHRMSQALMEE